MKVLVSVVPMPAPGRPRVGKPKWPNISVHTATALTTTAEPPIHSAIRGRSSAATKFRSTT